MLPLGNLSLFSGGIDSSLQSKFLDNSKFLKRTFVYRSCE